MLTSKVAKRYAQGLLNFTQEIGQTEQVAHEMVDVLKTIGNSRDLQNFLASPVIEEKKKISIAKEIFKGFSPITQNIIQLVIKHGREKELQNIAQDFVNKVEDLAGIQRITLTVATPLSQANTAKILATSSLVSSEKKTDVKTLVNPKILGGYILRVGDQQVDASVKAKLTKLEKEFQNN